METIASRYGGSDRVVIILRFSRLHWTTRNLTSEHFWWKVFVQFFLLFAIPRMASVFRTSFNVSRWIILVASTTNKHWSIWRSPTKAWERHTSQDAIFRKVWQTIPWLMYMAHQMACIRCHKVKVRSVKPI